MHTLFLLLRKEHITLYENINLVRKYVNGDECVHFRRSYLNEQLQKLCEDLCNEYNVDSKEDLTFVLLENEDKMLNAVVKSNLNIAFFIPLKDLLDETMNTLSKKNDLRIDLYGLNYDGRSYLISKNELVPGPFSLFAHTIQDDEFIDSGRNVILNFVKKNKIAL